MRNCKSFITFLAGLFIEKQQVEDAFKHMGTVIETIVKEALSYIAAESKSLGEAKDLADSIANAEITRLKQQNDLLKRLLESEKVKAGRAGEEFKQRVATLVDEFTAERDRSLREAFSEMSDSNTNAQKDMHRLAQQQGQQLDGVQQIGSEWGATVEKRRAEAKRTRDGGLKVVSIDIIRWLSAQIKRSPLNPSLPQYEVGSPRYLRRLRARPLSFLENSLKEYNAAMLKSTIVSIPRFCASTFVLRALHSV